MTPTHSTRGTWERVRQGSRCWTCHLQHEVISHGGGGSALLVLPGCWGAYGSGRVEPNSLGGNGNGGIHLMIFRPSKGRQRRIRRWRWDAVLRLVNEGGRKRLGSGHGT